MKDRVRRPRQDQGRLLNLGRYLPGTPLFWNLLVLGLVGVAGLVGFDFYRFATSSDAFRTQLRIRGLQNVPEEKVHAQLVPILKRSGRRRSLLGISVFEVQRRLRESIPRFESVAVAKEYPDHLRIEVRERTPLALIARLHHERNKRFYLPVDETGTVFPAEKGERTRLRETLPVVLGLEETDLSDAEFVKQWDPVRTLLVEIRERLSLDQVDWLEVRTGGHLTFQLNYPRTVDVRMGRGRLNSKMDKLVRLIQSPQFETVEQYVDLSQQDRVRVR